MEGQLKTKRFLVLACTLIGLGISRMIFVVHTSAPNTNLFWEIFASLFITIGMIFYAVGLISKLKKE